MLDYSLGSFEWGDEPSREELEQNLEIFKDSMINRFMLQKVNDDGTKIRLPKYYSKGEAIEETIYRIGYLAARQNLAQIVRFVKVVYPRQHFDLLDALLTNWMPAID